MFTERHHIPLPVFVFLGKTNSLLLVFSHLLSFLSLTHPPSPVLHLLLHEYTFLTEPYTVFLAHSCILVLNLPICSRTASLKLSCNRISRDTSPPYVPIAIRVPLLPPAASSALGSFPPLLPPARTSCTSFPHRLKTHTAQSWCQHSVLCSLCFCRALPPKLQVPVTLPCSSTLNQANSHRRLPWSYASWASFPCW